MKRVTFSCSRVFLSFGLLIPVAGLAQTSQSTEPFQILYEIDGAKNPETIPDLVAYRHFFAALAKSVSVSAEAAEARRLSYLKHFFRLGCGVQQNDDRTLSDLQMMRLLLVADDLAVKLREIDQRAKTSSPAGIALERDQAISASVQSIGSTVDPDAAAKVRRHVLQHVKSRMKITGFRIR